ncbi:MAG TPA: M67 family metallopeptidase [Solirubrobacteraceae bacterium]|nr:M67 family metallopeptidase [Solirubrobacteraceae bacterium]
MRIARRLVQEMIDHALAEAPNECCGVVATRDGEAVRVYPAQNIHASPLRYEISPEELLRVYMEIEDRGCELGAIYHSHTRSRPYPSQTDVNLAVGWPDPVYVIIGLAGDEPEYPAYAIRDGQVAEAELEVV